MKRLIFFISLFISIYQTGFTQDFWHEGAITLKNNLSISGELSFEAGLDKIKYKSTLYQKNFKLNDLIAFQFEDYELGIDRYFVIDQFEGNTALFEVIVEGRYPVYRQLKNIDLFNQEGTLTEDDYNFYISSEGTLVPFKDFEEKTLKQIVWDYPFEIRDFIYKYNLNLDVTAHKVLVMQHYNAITAPNIDHSRAQKLLSIR